MGHPPAGPQGQDERAKFLVTTWLARPCPANMRALRDLTEEQETLRASAIRLLTDEGDDFLATGGALAGALVREALGALGADPAPALVGQRIGSLRIEAVIGQGGMGRVYRAFDERLERAVALKAVLPAPAVSPLAAAARSRLHHEAKLLSQLNHPGICQVYDLTEHQGQDLLVLELVTGPTLRELLRMALPLPEVLRIGQAIAAALAAAHRKGIIHRDLKPENVVLDSDGAVKVLDFGIASLIAVTQEAGADHPQATAQDTGVIAGTLPYMSPEQAQGHPLTPASDLFSLGLLLVELATGRPLYDLRGLVDRDRLEAVRRGPTALPAGLDRDLAALVGRLLALDPARRPDARSTASRLAWITDRPARRRRRWWLTAALAATGSAALGLLAWGRMETAQRAQLAERFAREAAEVEWRMRSEQLAPIHDLGPVRAEINRRLAAVELLATDLDPAVRGPAAASLGRAAHALGELDRARAQLATARSAGVTGPEIDAVEGLVLAELYLRELDRLTATPQPEQRALARRRLEEDLRRPALAALARGAGTATASTPYLRAMTALLQERHDVAADLARAAAGDHPWNFEAHVLAAQVERRRAELAAARRDLATTEQALDRALRAYDAAVDSGRSAIAALAGRCALLSDRAVLRLQMASALPSLEEAAAGREACALAERVAPWLPDPPVHHALLDLLPHYRLSQPVELAAAFARTMPRLDGAVAAHPADPWVRSRRGFVLSGKTWFHLRRGEPEMLASADRYLEDGERIVELSPGDPLGGIYLGDALQTKAWAAFMSGSDPSPWLDRALTQIGRSVELFPEHAIYRYGLGSVGVLAGHVATSLGKPCENVLATAIENFARSGDGGRETARATSLAETGLGECRLEQGGDARAAFSSGIERVLAQAGGKPLDSLSSFALGNNYLGLARVAAAAGQDPAEPLAEAIDRHRRGLDVESGNVEAWYELVEMYAWRAELRLAEGAAGAAADLDAAKRSLAAAHRLNAELPMAARAAGTLARVEALAELAAGRDPAPALAAATAQLEKALAGFPPPRVRRHLEQLRSGAWPAPTR